MTQPPPPPPTSNQPPPPPPPTSNQPPPPPAPPPAPAPASNQPPPPPPPPGAAPTPEGSASSGAGRSFPTLLVAVVAVLLVGAGATVGLVLGRGADAPPEAAAPAPAETEEEEVAEDSGQPEDDVPADVEEPVAVTGDAGPFCAVTEEVGNLGDHATVEDTRRWIAAAPPEIADDVQTIGEMIITFLEGSYDSEEEEFAVFFELATDPEVTAAQARFEEYVAAACGFPPAATAETSTGVVSGHGVPVMGVPGDEVQQFVHDLMGPGWAGGMSMGTSWTGVGDDVEIWNVELSVEETLDVCEQLATFLAHHAAASGQARLVFENPQGRHLVVNDAVTRGDPGRCSPP